MYETNPVGHLTYLNLVADVGLDLLGKLRGRLRQSRGSRHSVTFILSIVYSFPGSAGCLPCGRTIFKG